MSYSPYPGRLSSAVSTGRNRRERAAKKVARRRERREGKPRLRRGARALRRGAIAAAVLAAAALALLAAPRARAERVSYYSDPPTTGSPCVAWEWESFDRTGFRFWHVLTAEPRLDLDVGDWASVTRCRCRDALERWSKFSVPSEIFRPESYLSRWRGAGTILRVGELSVTVAFAQTEAWPDSLEAPTP